MKSGSLGLVAGAFAALSATVSAAPQAAPVYDVIIAHGTVIDGTGAAGAPADVGIIGGRIAAVGKLARAKAAKRIDATGLYVTPGFINVHDHSTPQGLPTAVNMLTQGVTTALLNPDGWGELDIGKQMSDLAKPGLALNIGAYSGFNAIWASVVGMADQRPTEAQTARMRDIVTRNLEQGAWGVSAGLDYKPAYFAKAEEVIAVVSAAKTWRTNFPHHDRITPESGFSSRVGVAETISIASAAGLSPEITHMKAQGREQGKGPEILEMMRQATAAGHFTTGDVYPYLAGMSGLHALTVPGWAQAGGEAAMLARIKDPEVRAKVVKAVEEAMDARFGGASGVYMPESQRQLVDVAKAEGVSPGEALLRVIEHNEWMGILTFGAESDLRAFLREPTVAITCDCGADLATKTHPRAYGNYPRVLGHYVREAHVLTWPDAIRKMTGLPASSLGMVDRGFIAPGMAADIAVFDPRTIIDHATFEHPAQLSQGMRFVLVNGRIELADGKATGEKGGAVLLRADDMPTHPMDVLGDRHIRLEGLGLTDDVGRPVKLSLDVKQSKSGAAIGRIALTDERGRTIFSANAMGPLQTGDHWLSVSGWSRSRNGGAFTVTIDAGNPRRPTETTVKLRKATGKGYAGAMTRAGML